MIKNTIKKTQPYSSDTKHIEQNTSMSKLNNIWICSKNIREKENTHQRKTSDFIIRIKAYTYKL